MSEIYTKLRVLDAITSKYLGITDSGATQISISLEPLPAGKSIVIRLRQANKLSLMVNNSSLDWLADPLTQEELILLMISCKLGFKDYKKTIPQWFVCALRQAALHKEHFNEMIKNQPLPAMRTLLINNKVPGLERILKTKSHSKNRLIAEIEEQCCYILLLGLASSSRISKLRKTIFEPEDDLLPEIDRISSCLGFKDKTQLQNWYKQQVDLRTITSRFPAPPSYIKQVLNSVTTISYTTIKGKQKAARIEGLEPALKEISEDEFFRIKVQFFGAISRLGQISPSELSDILIKIIKTSDDFGHDDYDDFTKDYLKITKQLNGYFLRHSEIEKQLGEIENSSMQERQALDYIKELNNSASHVPEPWPALELYLDRIEKSF